MRKALLTGLLMVVVILSACSNNSSAPASEEEVQETVQNVYDKMLKFDEEGKTSLDNFNTTLASYSTGKASDKELEKAVDQFQDATAEIAEEVGEVKISKNLPEEVHKLLNESMIAFKSAYSIKEQASQSAVSPEVTAEEFNAMNEQADVAMLYGISKLNEARVAVGLIEDEDGTEAAGTGDAESGTAVGSTDVKLAPATENGTNSGTSTVTGGK